NPSSKPRASMDVSSDAPRRLASWSDPGADRTTRDHGEVQCKWEFLIDRTDFDAPDNRRQGEGDLEQREMVANARPWSPAERQVLPSIESLEVLRAEPLGAESQRVVPKLRITLHGHSPDHEHGAFRHQVAAYFDVPARHARSGGCRRAQPERLPYHLHGI